MKKYIFLIFLLMFSISLVACGNNINNNIVDEPNNDEIIKKEVSFEAKILEIHEKSILVEPVEGSNELKSSDKISLGVSNINIDFDLQLGQTIKIVYDGMIMESYPAQIIASKISLVESNNEDINEIEIIEFGGMKYIKEKLSGETLAWLSLTDEEKILSSYYPPEFIDNDDYLFVEEKEDCKVLFEAFDITSKGLTIICNQYCFDDECYFTTGSYYVVQKLENGEYIDIPYVVDGDVGWTSEAWIIRKNQSMAWEVDWEWLYGELSKGEYRIGKEVVNEVEYGVFEKNMVYANFEIK